MRRKRRSNANTRNEALNPQSLLSFLLRVSAARGPDFVFLVGGIRKKAGRLVRLFFLKWVSVFSSLTPLRTTTLSSRLAIFDHLIECGLGILHQRGVRRTTITLRPLLLGLINGLRCFRFRHQDFHRLCSLSYMSRTPRRPSPSGALFYSMNITLFHPFLTLSRQQFQRRSRHRI
jgi:hypothetical protein